MIKEIKPRRCPICLEMYTPKRYGLRITRCCENAGCRLDYAQGVKAKEASKEAKKSKKEFYEKDVRWQHKQCQPVFNKLRRLQEFKWFKDRGIEPYCISCGNTLGGDVWACGHLKTVGAQSGLRYDPRNTYLQHNKRCNKDLSGDIYGTKTTHGFIQGLKNRFGEDGAAQIIEFCETNTAIHRWTWQELKEMRSGWSAQIRKLEKELGIN